jgi:hypothetical protein
MKNASPSIEDVMEFLVDNRTPDLELNVLADIFDRLIWVVDDNGAGIGIVRRKWLNGDDATRVEVALRMEEVFPFQSREEMEGTFSEISRRWPRFGHLCEKILHQWDIQFSPRVCPPSE